MYASGKDFVKDFALRTKQNYYALKGSPYEVTQLINAMVGLLIIPEQILFDHISDSLLSDELFQKMSSCVAFNTYKKPINLREICRHLRNAVAHSHIEFQAEKPNISTNQLIIHSVTFTDINEKTKERIKILVPISLLEEFLLTFSDSVTNLA